MSSRYELVQYNLARLKAPYDSPLLADFRARLDEVNAAAEASPGFVWRWLEGVEDLGPDPWGDPLWLQNLSLWTGVAALRAFVYRHHHAELLRDRGRWFERTGQPAYVLWWIPAGERPTLVEARARIERLGRDGPGPAAFGFERSFAAPEQGQA